MVIAELDEVTYDLEVDGELVRRTIHRRIWERRGWATVAVAYQERDREGAWKPGKLALLRFQRVHEAWKKHGSITLSGEEAVALGETLRAWGADLDGNVDE